MSDAPKTCPPCRVPTRLSINGKVPGVADEVLAKRPVLYCPKCKTTWVLNEPR